MVKAFTKKSNTEYIHRQSASKKIVKVKESEKTMITSRILPLDNFEDFVKFDTVKFRKIQKTTQLKTIINKKLLVKAIKALILDSQDVKEETEKEVDNFIILDVKMGQVPDSYSIKPYQL